MKTIPHRIITVLAIACAALFVLGGCTSGKKGSPTYSGDGLDGDGTLPTDNVGAGIPMSNRPEGINPDTDVDYSVLSAQTVYFDYDKSTVKASERPKLEAVKKWLDENPGKRLMLAGHTDIRGTPEYNRGLGERRAQSVREYLIGLGANGSDLYTISYGLERLASQGTAEDDHAKNRRVEVGVITK